MTRRVFLGLSLSEALLEVLLVLCQWLRVDAVCPTVCSCSPSHREVDCSWRALKLLPNGLQHNLRSLNLSHNRFHDLDNQLTVYTHLRILDLSHNRLSRLPADLPRSLWQLHASTNRVPLLDKNDTVYQWNLRVLDLSHNKLERAIFINNTLSNLRTLNLSHNHLWTLPTNLPAHLESIDLSNNLLIKVLPGSLDRLPGLTHFYLHANRFTALPFAALDKLTSLRIITLEGNPWGCHLHADIAYLLSWSQRSSALILGCPCHTQTVCGGVRPSRTGRWHFGSYNSPPLAAGAQEMSSSPPPEGIVTMFWFHKIPTQAIITSSLTPQPEETRQSLHFHLAPASTTDKDHMWHTSLTSPANALHTAGTSSTSDTGLIRDTITDRDDSTLATAWVFITENPSLQTKKTTTLRTRSVRRNNHSFPSGGKNNSPTTHSPTFKFWYFSLLFLLD
ncbi:oligodendrocyte-myelin glycoprotein isoform X2 [Gouania willdenowi]|uniref:oligodendrocyte-myelin glycoprotein isoform X2 n=1 Tax=Gouania willdenowi TaxID=441366 RepID=UPI001054E95B|nr:oligodendrocyte-myelin glycoprotein isoform X2 [Gouania willdenowi]